MRFTYKKILSLVLALLMLMSLAACNTNDDTTGPVGPDPEEVRNTQAITVGEYTLNAVEVNYFYMDTISNYCNQLGYYISYLINLKQPLSQQIADKETNATWADTFLEMAKDNIKSTYALYDLAVKNGHTLKENEQQVLDNMDKNILDYAVKNGYADADAYLAFAYGAGADLESYHRYYEICMMADSYYYAYGNSLEYDDADLRAYEQDKFHNYSAFSYSSYYLAADKFYKGGTTDSQGNTTYSDEEKKAAAEEALQVANGLAEGQYADDDAFDAAIQALSINEGVTTAKCTRNKDIQFSKLNTLFSEWLTAEGRVEGDMVVIPNETGSGDTKTVTGYYILRFGGINDNSFKLKNVRHVLIAFEGGTYNPTTGQTTYTDKEKNIAKVTAEQLLATWAEGDKSEESFAALAKEHTDDGNGDVGGLYEDIYPGQMVTSFNDWCFDESRQPGDYGLVETQYGYHLMFFSGDSDISYRDMMITNEMRNADVNKWYEELVKAITLTDLDLKFVNKDLILSA